ncbi:MAG: hypothetical protein RJA07_700 [Bacteroidota bacterium]
MKKTLLLSAFALFLASSSLVANACDKDAKGAKHECTKGGACCKKGASEGKSCCKKGATDAKPAAPSNEKK